MDLYNFLDLKSSEIGKLCSKPGNEVKFASFILHYWYIYAFEDLSKIKYSIFNVKNERFSIVNPKNYL